MSQIETDVAVVGSGPAGMAAAIAAAENGARVVITEKGATIGGTGNMAMGPFAVESRLQKEKNVPLTKEQAFKIHMDYTHWRVDARLVKAYIDKSAETIDWLEELGIEFNEPATMFSGSQPTWHLIKTSTSSYAPQAAANMMKILTDRAKESGVQIFLRTPVKKILEETGRIVGVIAEDNSQEEIKASAKAVIIATGGYGAEIPPFPNLTGDGIHMAREVGADASEITVERGGGAGVGGPGPSLGRIYTVIFTFGQPNLVVNLLGERFVNEELMLSTVFWRNAVARQKMELPSLFSMKLRKNTMWKQALISCLGVFRFLSPKLAILMLS